jgi:DNA-binding NtrC family response regulator
MAAPVILCIDDDPFRLTTLSEVLSAQGYSVLTAPEAKSGLELFLAHDNIELVVTDYYMPGKNGAMLALDMKHAKPWVQILLISGTLTMPEFVIALVDGFHPSGDETEQLLAKVKELLHKSQKATGAA